MARSAFAQIKLNLPPAMRDQLKSAAGGSNRSLNSEIIHRLSNREGLPMPAEEPATGKSATLTVRLSAEMREKLDSLAVSGPYRISITSIVERGIELAAQELEQMAARQKGGEA